MWVVAKDASVKKGIELVNPLQPGSTNKDLHAARTIQHFYTRRQEKKENDIHLLPYSTRVRAVNPIKKTLMEGGVSSDTNSIFKVELFDSIKLEYEVRRTYKSFVALAEIASSVFPEEDVHMLSAPKKSSGLVKPLHVALKSTLKRIIDAQQKQDEKESLDDDKSHDPHWSDDVEHVAIQRDIRFKEFSILLAKFCRLSDLDMAVNDFEDYITHAAQKKARSKLNFRKLAQPIAAFRLANPVTGSHKRASLFTKKKGPNDVGDVERTTMARAGSGTTTGGTNFFTLFELFLDFVQKVSLIVLVDVEWPSPFYDVAKYLGVLTFDFGPLFGSLSAAGAAWARLIAMLSIHPFLILFFVVFMMCNTEEYRKSWMRRNYTNWLERGRFGIRRSTYLFGCWAVPCAGMIGSIFCRPKLSDGNWNYHFSVGLVFVWTVLCAFWQVPIYIKRYYLKSWINIAGDSDVDNDGDKTEKTDVDNDGDKTEKTNPGDDGKVDDKTSVDGDRHAKELFWEHLAFYQARIFGLMYAATFLAGVRVILGTWVEGANAPQFQDTDGPKTELMLMVGIGACMFVMMIAPAALLVAVYYSKGFKLAFDSETGFTLVEGKLSGVDFESKCGAFSINTHGVLSSTDRFPTCVLPYKLPEGSSYFEIEIIEVGSMPQLGFADSNAEFDFEQGVGDDRDHSWAIDGARETLWPMQRFGRRWKNGDIVGFLAEVKDGEATITFSLNGDFEDGMGVAFEKVPFVGFLQPALTLGGGAEVRVHVLRRNFKYPPSVQAIPMPSTWLTRVESLAACGQTLLPADRTKRVLRLCLLQCVLWWAAAVVLPALVVSSSSGVGVYAVVMSLAIIGILVMGYRWHYAKPVGGMFVEGDEVEADENGDGNYRPGKIKRVRSNGSYTVVLHDEFGHIEYDSDDEIDVVICEASYIRLVKGASSSKLQQSFAALKRLAIRVFIVGVLVLFTGMFFILYYSMQSRTSKMEALLVFSGFAAVPYFFFPPFLLYYASNLAYKYLRAQAPVHFSRIKRLKTTLDREGSKLRTIRGFKSSANDGKPKLTRQQSIKMKATRDLQYNHVLEAQKALGDDKPLELGDLAMMRPTTKHENNEAEEGFNQLVRILHVNGEVGGNMLFDCVKTHPNGKYQKLAYGNTRKGKGLNLKNFKNEVFLNVAARNLQRKVEHDDVTILLQKSMISFIQPFEPDRFWFKTYVLLEKLVLAAVTVLSFGNLRVQCGVLIAVGVFGLLISIVVSPYMHWKEDGADMFQRLASLVICLIPYLIDVGLVNRATGNIVLFVTVALVFVVIMYCLQLGTIFSMGRSFIRSQAVLGAVKEVQKTPDHSKLKSWRNGYIATTQGNAGYRMLNYLQYQVYGKDLKSWKPLDKAYLVILYGNTKLVRTEALKSTLRKLKFEGQLPLKIPSCILIRKTATGDNYRLALQRQATFILAETHDGAVHRTKAGTHPDNKFLCIDLHFVKEQPKKTHPACNVTIDADLIVQMARKCRNGSRETALFFQPILIFLPLWLVEEFERKGKLVELQNSLNKMDAAGAGTNMLYLGAIMQKEAYLQTHIDYLNFTQSRPRMTQMDARAEAQMDQMTVNLEFGALRMPEADMEKITPIIWKGVLKNARASWPRMTQLFTPKAITRKIPNFFPPIFDKVFAEPVRDPGQAKDKKDALLGHDALFSGQPKILHTGAFATQKELDTFRGLLSAADSVPKESINLMESFSTESSELHKCGLARNDDDSSSRWTTFTVTKTTGPALADIVKYFVVPRSSDWTFRTSPDGPLSLPQEVRAQLFIPDSATKFRFAYPLAKLNTYSRNPDCNFLTRQAEYTLAKAKRNFNNPDCNFLAFGGYIYLNEKDEVVACNALCYKTDADAASKAKFQSAVDCEEDIEQALEASGRFETPDQQMQEAGATGYAWIMPGEFVVGAAGSAKFENTHGGFVFQLQVARERRCLAFLLSDGSETSHHVGGGGGAAVVVSGGKMDYKLKVVTELLPQAAAELEAEFGIPVQTMASNWKIMYNNSGASRMVDFVRSFKGLNVSVNALTESPEEGNKDIEYSTIEDSSTGCIGTRLESFLAKDVATGLQFASHVLLAHPNFCNRPTCLVFYTTW
jgi:hypothetical protein